MHSGRLCLPWRRKSPGITQNHWKSPKSPRNHEKVTWNHQNDLKSAQTPPRRPQPMKFGWNVLSFPAGTEPPEITGIHWKSQKSKEITQNPENNRKSPEITEILRKYVKMYVKKPFIIHAFWEALPALAKKIT